VSQITVKVPVNLKRKIGKDNVSIDAENVKDALEKLESKFSEKFSEGFYIFFLNGCILDKKKLNQIKLSSGDTLHIFLPVGGG